MGHIDLLSGLIYFAVFCVFGFFIIMKNNNPIFDKQLQIKIFIISYILRYSCSVAIYEFGLVNVIKDEDAGGWVFGLVMNSEWQENGVGLLDLPAILLESFSDHGGIVGSRNRGYTYVLSLLFYFTGTSNRLAVTALNGFLGALTVVFVYRIAVLNFSAWVAKSVGWIICFLPSFIIWSAQTLKEPIVIFIEVIAIYSCYQIKHFGVSFKYLIFCLAGILLLYPFRFYASYVLGFSIAASMAFFLLMPDTEENKTFRYVLFSVFVAFGLFSFYSSHLGAGLAQEFDFRQIQAIRRDLAYGAGAGSGIDLGYDLSSPSGVIMTLLVGGLYLLLSPFPWNWGGASLRLVLTAPESALWWTIFCGGVVPGLWYVLRHRLRECLPFLFFCFALAVPYSLMFANIGLAYRQRAQLLPWLLILGMVGFERIKLRHTRSGGLKEQERQVNAGTTAPFHSRPPLSSKGLRRPIRF